MRGDRDVVVIFQPFLIEMPTAGDQDQPRLTASVEQPRHRGLFLGPLLSGHHAEPPGLAVVPDDVDEVAGLQIADPGEHPGALRLVVDVPDQDGRPGRSRRGAESVPADGPDVRRHLHPAVRGDPRRDDRRVDAQIRHPHPRR